MYSLSQFLFYPLFAASIIFYGWEFALAVFGLRFLMQAIVYYAAMKKLQEKDLYPWFLFFDIWMFFYYLLFSVSLIKKPKRGW